MQRLKASTLESHVLKLRVLEFLELAPASVLDS